MFNLLILKSQSDFYIYHPITIFNFAKKLAQNQYLCEGS